MIIHFIDDFGRQADYDGVDVALDGSFCEYKLEDLIYEINQVANLKCISALPLISR